MRVLIAIPVFNERKYVDHVLAKVLKIHPDVLLIDDGSTDGTAEVLEARSDIQLIRHDRNMGYGQSLIDAFNYADQCGYDWVITMDCDEQHEPERIVDFIKAIKTDKWDIISGSRYLKPMSKNDLPPGDRRNINAKLTELVNETFGWDLTDTFCGFKAHRVSAMRPLHLTETGYAFPMQLWPQVFRAGLRVTEIPVRLIYNDPTRTFGGILDDADRRLKHYLDVFNTELTADRTDDVEMVSDRSFCCC
jgi:glycosyltransferase involved in cell wall biosynthesis